MTAPPTPKASPLSTKLRVRAEDIHKLLEEYLELRYGDKDWQQGDEVFRKGTIILFCLNCKKEYPPYANLTKCSCGGDLQGTRKGIPPETIGKKPQIHAITSPSRIFYAEESTASEEVEIANPLLIAMYNLNELSPREAKGFLLQNRYNIITGLGVVERYDASVLLSWLRRLAKHITYILETREIYSEEIKAVYPELLNDMEIARSLCDQLSYALGKQNGVLNKKQFTEQVAKLLHYAEICESSANQLADHHDAFVGGEISSLEDTVETVWVKEGTTPEEQAEAKSKKGQGEGEEE